MAENNLTIDKVEQDPYKGNNKKTLEEELERRNLILCKGCLNNKRDAMDQTF